MYDDGDLRRDGASAAYVRWEEVQGSGDKGRRLVFYYLKDAAGRSDLAVIGREKSARHMAYDVAGSFRRKLPVLDASPSSTSSSVSAWGDSRRLRSRKEVVDWLSSLVSDSLYCSSIGNRSQEYGNRSQEYGNRSQEYGNCAPAAAASLPVTKRSCIQKTSHRSKDFTWLNPSRCSRRRNHYHSFCRNGIKISIHDFVYIMGEDNKRLVAYVEDMYEDLNSGNVVHVRWFHKVEEVGFALPSDTNGREIFFTPHYQDLSIECIDGLVAVLNSKHFEKYLNEEASITWESFLCRREIDNADDIKPFDISHIPGYWNQEVLRHMNQERQLTICEGVAEDGQDFCLPGKGALNQTFQMQLSAGCEVEVLSQDSGMRGCWFRCVILKRCKDKIKVQYKDIQDVDGVSNLEEWLFALKVAAVDNLGIRLKGRTKVRPHPSPMSNVKHSFDIGSVVDVWWHNGWWEGIVIFIESYHRMSVFFPGEGQTASFDQEELRHSLDYMQGKWTEMVDRPDIVSLLLSSQELRMDIKGSQGHAPSQTSGSRGHRSSSLKIRCKLHAGRTTSSELVPCCSDMEEDNEELGQAASCNLKWGFSRKRTRNSTRKGTFTLKKQGIDHGGFKYQNTRGDTSVSFQFHLNKPFSADTENCKVRGNASFNPPMYMSNLVMTCYLQLELPD